jgi:hypothetical protein
MTVGISYFLRNEMVTMAVAAAANETSRNDASASVGSDRLEIANSGSR